MFVLECATCGFCGAGPEGPVAVFDTDDDARIEGLAHAKATGHAVSIVEVEPMEDDYPTSTEPVEVEPEPVVDIDAECEAFRRHLDGLLNFAPHEFWKRLVLA